jgi:PhzF family phenazine biosynthesis protein
MAGVKSLTMFQVDAFADRLFTGNPAAVLVLEDWLSDGVMQAIAEENNLAETAFVRPCREGHDLRWFTPVREVDFCGHATLASAHVLIEELGWDTEAVFSTRVGTLRVARQDDGYRMDFPSFPPEIAVPVPKELAAIAGPSCVAAFRNFENWFVELSDEATVRAFIPDLKAIEALDAGGLVVTGHGQSADFVSRYFAPAAGIDEDPVTGSIHSTLTPYWAEKLGRTTLSARQVSRRGGDLKCELLGERVFITGQAVTFMKATINVSDM